jgi:DNA-binding MarR family transcriptional regulator
MEGRPASAEAIGRVRRFNRFYTRRIGVLREGLLGSRYSLVQVRVLYEIAGRDGPSAVELAEELDLDPGYLSRILRGFTTTGLVRGRRSKTDRRRSHLFLTPRGKAAFDALDKGADSEVGSLLCELSARDQQRLAGAMDTIESLLGTLRETPCVLRSHQAGDLGWIVHRHGVLYSEEYGWDETFEALVAQIAAKFIEKENPRKERCFVAERGGEILGCAFLVDAGGEEAKLRLLLVEPKARGLGLGTRLVGECVRFARQAGYKKISLWTNDVLLAARHLYEKAGFSLVHREPHHSFGRDLVGESWELGLG